MTHKRGDETFAVFLANLSETANITRSADAAGINRSTVFRKRKEDPEFDKLYLEAYQIGYTKLEEEAQRRAFTGYEEPVFYKGRKVATVTKYSDSLAMFLLKGNLADKFKDRSEVTHAGTNDRHARLTDEELDAELKKRGIK